jgi:hypothetical protein
MSYDRQLDILVAILLTVLTLVGCIFYIGISAKASLLVSAGVFLAVLFFGRRIAEVVTSLFG